MPQHRGRASYPRPLSHPLPPAIINICFRHHLNSFRAAWAICHPPLLLIRSRKVLLVWNSGPSEDFLCIRCCLHCASGQAGPAGSRLSKMCSQREKAHSAGRLRSFVTGDQISAMTISWSSGSSESSGCNTRAMGSTWLLSRYSV